MEMDLGSTIIGAIAIIICALPFVMASRTKKKSEKKILQSLNNIAIQNNCQLNEHEIFDNFAIGLDETRKMVFFTRAINDDPEEKSVDLREIQSCEVVNTSKTLKNKEGNQKVIERLELSFKSTARNKPDIKLEFFNVNVSVQLNGEHQSIEKWSKLINDLLKTNG